MKIIYLLMFSFLYQIDYLDICGTYQTEDQVFEYGSYKQDAYIMSQNTETSEVLFELTYDSGQIDKFIYLADVGNGFFILILEINHGEDYKLLKYHSNGELIEELDLAFKVLNAYNHHFHLVVKTIDGYVYVNSSLNIINQLSLDFNVVDDIQIQYQGSLFINGFISDSNIIDEIGNYEIEIIDDEYRFFYEIKMLSNVKIIGNEKNNGYYGSIYIEAEGDLLLNGNKYNNKTMIEQPGKYLLEIFVNQRFLQKEEFIIYPEVSYYNGIDNFELKNDIVLSESINIYSNVSTMMINDQPYHGELIEDIGDYQLKLMDEDYLLDIIYFRLESHVEGVENKETYEEVSFYVFGKVYLNDQIIQGYQHLSEPGAYHIKIYDQYKIVEEIQFTIIGQNDSLDKHIYNYLILAVVLLGIGLIYFKK